MIISMNVLASGPLLNLWYLLFCTRAYVRFISFISHSLNLIFQVKYEVLPGWQSDISSVRSYSELPLAAQRYVERIEDLVGVPVHYIGVGPGRDALIYK